MVLFSPVIHITDMGTQAFRTSSVYYSAEVNIISKSLFLLKIIYIYRACLRLASHLNHAELAG
jgi:hypothetical protein